MKRSGPLIYTLPVLTLAAGAAVLLLSYWDHKRDVDEVERLYKAHVDSVAQLVKEGAREASASTALIYDMAEASLLSISQALPEHPTVSTVESLLVWLRLDGEQVTGRFGPVPGASRQSLVDWMRSAPEDVLIDDGPLRPFGLACLLRSSENTTALILCRDAEELSVLRQEIGIGPLLKGVIKKDTLYVALQDKEGILSVAPSHDLLSPWDGDAFLQATLKAGSATGATRLRKLGNDTVFEGVIPFLMADDSTVLLRVGIDAAPLERIRKSAWQRFFVLVGLVLGIFFLSVVVALILRRWHLKQLELVRMIEEEEKKRHHWETIGQMAATVAHEVRNPLNTMGMLNQRLKQEFKIDAEERPAFNEMLDILGSESKRVERFVTEFLELGKPLHLSRQRISPRDMIQEALLPMVMRAEKEQKNVEFDIGNNDEVDVDVDRLRQALNNLVANALDAVDAPGGKVIVHAAATIEGLTIEIRDNGPGMTDAKLAEVRMPFVSFKSTGTGLGLPLVTRIVEAHGGTLTLTSQPSEGTCATVSIPSFINQKDETP